MPNAANMPAPASAPADPGAVRGGARDAHGGHQLVARDVVGDQRGAHAEVGRAHQAVEAGNDEHEHRVQGAGERKRHEEDGQRRIGGAHDAEQVAMADPVAGHAEQRRHQRARELQRAEQGQQQHRAGLDQHVPAQDQRLHLEGAGGEQVGGPLQAEGAHPEGRQAGRPDERAQARAQWCIDLPPPPRLRAAMRLAAPAVTSQDRARSMKSGRSALPQSGMAAIFFSLSRTSAWACM